MLSGGVRLKQTCPADSSREPEFPNLHPCLSSPHSALKHKCWLTQRQHGLRSQDVTLATSECLTGPVPQALVFLPSPDLLCTPCKADQAPWGHSPTISVPLVTYPEEQRQLRKWAARTRPFCAPLYTQHLAQCWVFSRYLINTFWINSIGKSLIIYSLLASESLG